MLKVKLWTAQIDCDAIRDIYHGNFTHAQKLKVPDHVVESFDNNSTYEGGVFNAKEKNTD